MASPSEKLAHSLAALKELQDRDIVAIRTKDLTRTHRERLLKNGFIQEVMKGWYIPSRPDETAGESTAWYASFWHFAGDYLTARFGDKWCLSPEQSLSLHIDDWTVPCQLLARSPKGGNKPTSLLHNTSILDLRLEIPKQDDIETIDRLQIMNLSTALIACSPSQYAHRPIELRAALSSVTDASELLRKLLTGNHSTVAGRLAGAFRNIGRDKIADTIIETMRSAGHTIQESDPFADKTAIVLSSREVSPSVNRLKMMWEAFREPIIEHFPASPGVITDHEAYLHRLDELFVTDAYHSLSIEGYRVNEALIERVREGNWRPDTALEDHEQKDALAARGYWQSFRAVKKSVIKVLEGNIAGSIVGNDHAIWYRELFGPCVTAGIIQAADLAGYRNRPIYIRRSMHTPPNWEAVRELMPPFFELLEKEENPAVRVVLGHFIFVYIHPYVDGNGRIGRFLMNAMLAAGGYSWVIIPVEQRQDYMDALESASANQDIVPFAKFLAGQVNQAETL